MPLKHAMMHAYMNSAVCMQINMCKYDCAEKRELLISVILLQLMSLRNAAFRIEN